jgi:hypothetical protein
VGGEFTLRVRGSSARFENSTSSFFRLNHNAKDGSRIAIFEVKTKVCFNHEASEPLGQLTGVLSVIWEIFG